MQGLDLYNVIGQLYVNLITVQGTIKELQERLDEMNKLPTQEQKEAEQVSKTRDPIPL